MSFELSFYVIFQFRIIYLCWILHEISSQQAVKNIRTIDVVWKWAPSADGINGWFHELKETVKFKRRITFVRVTTSPAECNNENNNSTLGHLRVNFDWCETHDPKLMSSPMQEKYQLMRTQTYLWQRIWNLSPIFHPSNLELM